jgi:hypothetical protein
LRDFELVHAEALAAAGDEVEFVYFPTPRSFSGKCSAGSECGFLHCRALKERGCSNFSRSKLR